MRISTPRRRPILSIVGNSGVIPEHQRTLAFELGRRAVEAGFRIACGGRDGVMEAAAQGAHAAVNYQNGDTVGIGPSYGHEDQNPWIDVVIPTGLGFARNMVVVSTGHVVVAIGGGPGTLSEIALAWQIGRPVLALQGAEGWAEHLADSGAPGQGPVPIELFSDSGALLDRARSLAATVAPQHVSVGR